MNSQLYRVALHFIFLTYSLLLGDIFISGQFSNMRLSIISSLQVNYGQYIKIMPSTISVPCAGGGGVVFKELIKDGKKERDVSSKMYCGANTKIPAITSTGVRLEIYFKAPVSKNYAKIKVYETTIGTFVRSRVRD